MGLSGHLKQLSSRALIYRSSNEMDESASSDDEDKEDEARSGLKEMFACPVVGLCEFDHRDLGRR